MKNVVFVSSLCKGRYACAHLQMCHEFAGLNHKAGVFDFYSYWSFNFLPSGSMGNGVGIQMVFLVVPRYTTHCFS